ncbi:TetR/AcrR family transcriptional regulator [Desulfitobacterium sp. PCE1]|uniref:Transcriptional regulator n=2 Tax=Desulfitobacterium dehalogenans TaxID=36854 RepID=I4A511_DESDJ|nr:TetR family transcriptional regulator [Desulfitobacterium sp. PCE1]AFL99045.1 transcriptional regulator [Desulfitobacterium dehalogenans ATCC 51507]
MEQNISEALLFKGLSELLHKKTIDKLSVTDIIKASGVSRATFYRYYTDKYDLLNSNYKKILENTLFRFDEGIPWRDTQYQLYQELKDNLKLFQNAIRSSDVNSLKNYIFTISMDFFLGVLKKNKVDIHDWKVRKKIEACVYGNLEITVIWILEGAEEPIKDLMEVMNAVLPSEFRRYFIPDEQENGDRYSLCSDDCCFV